MLSTPGAPAKPTVLHEVTADRLVLRIVDDAACPPHRVDAAGNVVDAVLRTRMVLEESRDRAVAALIESEQLLEEIEHAVRIVAGRGHVLQARIVRRFLIRAAESRHHAAGENLRDDLR